MMKFIATAVLAASLFAAPGLATSGASAAGLSPLCGPGAAEALKRPGGFCEQIDSNDSLSAPMDDECDPFPYIEMLSSLAAGESVQVAETCYDYYPVII